MGRTPKDHQCHLRIAMSRETISIAAVFLGSLSALPARSCLSVRLHQLSAQVQHNKERRKCEFQRISSSAPPTATASTKSPNKAIVSRHLQGDGLSSRKAIKCQWHYDLPFLQDFILLRPHTDDLPLRWNPQGPLVANWQYMYKWYCMNKIQYSIYFLPIYLLTYSLIYRYWICHTHVWGQRQGWAKLGLRKAQSKAWGCGRGNWQAWTATMKTQAAATCDQKVAQMW